MLIFFPSFTWWAKQLWPFRCYYYNSKETRTMVLHVHLDGHKTKSKQKQIMLHVHKNSFHFKNKSWCFMFTFRGTHFFTVSCLADSWPLFKLWPLKWSTAVFLGLRAIKWNLYVGNDSGDVKSLLSILDFLSKTGCQESPSGWGWACGSRCQPLI